MENQSQKSLIRNITIFTILVILLPWGGRWLDSLSGISNPAEAPGMLIWILTPLVVSFLLRAFAGDGWKDLGIKPALKGNGKWYALSILCYPVVVGLVVFLGAVFRVTSFENFQTNLFFSGMLMALAPQFFQNIFEEFGFRGYLAPKMNKIGVNPIFAHSFVGLIWGLWHLPYISAITPYTTESLVTLVPRFLVGTIAVSIVYGEIRLLTNSVWLAIIMQTAGGVVLSGLLLKNLVTFSPGMRFLFAPVVEGLLCILLVFVIGMSIFHWRRKQV